MKFFVGSLASGAGLSLLADSVLPTTVAGSSTASWVTAALVGAAVLYLRRMANEIDDMKRTVGFIDRDLHVMASANPDVKLPRRE